MGLREPRAGLRPVRLQFDSNQPHKTSVVIPAGAELEVPEAIASVLEQNPHFKRVGSKAPADPAPEPSLMPQSDDGVGGPPPRARKRRGGEG